MGINRYSLYGYIEGRYFPKKEIIEGLAKLLNTTQYKIKREFILAYNQKHEIPWTPTKEKIKQPKPKKINLYERKEGNFWQNTLVHSDLTNKTIALKIGLKQSNRISAFTTGKAVPTEEQIRKFCELFNVDFTKGKDEFIQAHKKYNEEHLFANNRGECDTYWGKLKKAKGYSYAYIVTKVGRSQPTITQYFRGDGIPRDEDLIKLCDLFNVNFDEGKAKFEEDFKKKHPNKNWHNRDEELIVKYPPPPNKAFRTYKENFWSKKRVSGGIPNKKLSNLLGGVSIQGIYNWFTGRNIPSDIYIRKLCDIYNVDYEKGKQEFIKAHEQWYSWHYDKKKACVMTEEGRLYEPTKKTFVEVEKKKVEPEPEKKPYWKDVLGQDFDSKVQATIYNKTSFELYERIRFLCRDIKFTSKEEFARSQKDTILSELYGEIDLFSYDKVYHILNF